MGYDFMRMPEGGGDCLVMMHGVHGYEESNGQVAGDVLAQLASVGWKNKHDGKPCKCNMYHHLRSNSPLT